MDPNKKITKKFTKNFDTDVDNRQYFHRKTALKTAYLLFRVGTFNSFLLVLSEIECTSIHPV